MNLESIINELQKDYEFIIQNHTSSNELKNNLWKKRLSKWSKRITSNGKIDTKKLINFRARAITLSETPCNPYYGFLILENIYKFIHFSGFKETCFYNFNKVKNEKGYHWDTFSNVGNPFYYKKNGKIFNERFIRHLRTVDLVKKYVKDEHNSIVVDIGGGYGQFLCMLEKINHFSKKILIEIPEQLLFAYFYIKKCFPNIKINNIRDVYKDNFSIEDELKKNDFVLIPDTLISKLDKINPDLICNFNSFGEMSNNDFNNYMNSMLLKNCNYLFLINRLDSFPTYKNKISILDYNLERFDKLHFQTSPLWDYFFKSFSPLNIKKISFYSRMFEYIGKNKKI